MIDPLGNNLFDLPQYEDTEDETFPPFPPPSSPGRDDDGALANEEPAGNKSSQTKDSAVSTKKAIKRPIPKLDAQRLVSERGLPALRHIFDNAKFKGKGHETEDLKTLLRHMEHWAHRLFPKLQFDDFIDRVESLGNKREVQTCLKRIRLDLPILHEDFTSNEGSGVGNNGLKTSPEELDPFSENTREEFDDSHLSTTLTEKQQQRIERNRQLALERRQAKMQFNSQSQENDLSATHPNEEFKIIVAQDPDDLPEVEAQAAEAKIADMEAVAEDIQLKCAEEIK